MAIILVVYVCLCLPALTLSQTPIHSGDQRSSSVPPSFTHLHEDISESYYTTAYINLSFVDPQTGRAVREKTEIGKFGESHIGFSSGVLVHVRSGPDSSGCSLPFRSSAGTGLLPQEPWIALVRRGGCNFQLKVDNAYTSNASGVIIYNDRDSSSLEKMKLTLRAKRRPLAAVFTYKWKGEELAALLDNGTRVWTEVTVAHHCSVRSSINRTSVLFVSISFVVLMLISLAWLVFYYVQRFRYIHSKDRLSRRLCTAAKKALSMIPTKHIKCDDKELQGDGECCAICIEPYRTTEVVRILPCRHEFHRGCIDPWLVEHRTCPMCKMDILKHYGFVFFGSQESILHMDIEEMVSESELFPRTANHSASPPPLVFTQFQVCGNTSPQPSHSSRASSPDELTPSLPPPAVVLRPETVLGCPELQSVMAPSPLRRSHSLDNCSQ